MTTPHLDMQQHPITSDDCVAGCRERLDSDGALVLRGFAMPDTVRQIYVSIRSRTHVERSTVGIYGNRYVLNS